MAAYFSFQQESPDGGLHEFIFKLEDAAKIDEARSILANPSATKVHVLGTIVTSPAPYNPAWSFHLVPHSISFFELAAEVCDANVTYVEKHLADVGSDFLPGNAWCPWSSRLNAEVSARIDSDTEALQR